MRIITTSASMGRLRYFVYILSKLISLLSYKFAGRILNKNIVIYVCCYNESSLNIVSKKAKLV